MKKLTLTLFILFSAVVLMHSRVPNPVVMPDIPGYKTLKFDFHIHTSFSDGSVWPTTRIAEARYEGMEGLSITDHLDSRLQKMVLQFPSDSIDRNSSWKVASAKAASSGLICIHGGEISLGSSIFPGHFNVHFLKDGNAVAAAEDKYLNGKGDKKTKNEKALVAALKEARSQGAFLVWNHPNWYNQAPLRTEWQPIHESIYKAGLMDGIEIVNQISGLYCPEAFHWAIQKNLTIVSGSDAHHPMFETVDWALGEHRPMTLVFAEKKSEAAVREALDNHRTAVLDNNKIYGREDVLLPLAKACLTVEKVKPRKDGAIVYLKNNSSVPMILQRASDTDMVSYDRTIRINALESMSVVVKYLDGQAGADGFSMDLYVENFEVDAGVPLRIAIPVKKQ